MSSDELRNETEYDPAKDPFACSICGCSLPESKRIQGDDYCDGCQREYGGLL